MSTIEDFSYGMDVAALDPAALGKALAEAGLKASTKPGVVAKAALGIALEESAVGLHATRKLLGGNGDAPEKPEPGDRRFSDPAWTENPVLSGVLGSYLVASRWARRMLEDAELPEPKARKAEFALELFLDATAPSNIPWLNPVVLKEAINTGGLSLVRGFANFVGDVATNGGMPRQVQPGQFVVGRDLAVTPGRVVLKNELIELIAYEPQTETVFAEPLVFSPPWINKYYIQDLAPGRSWIEYAVQHGFTVFAISYRNPDASMAHLTMDDYLREGLFAALDRAQELTGSACVNIQGLCLGGTLATIGVAVLAARGQADRVGWLSLNNTLVDFAEPGVLGVFTDEETIRRIEQKNKRRGFLDATELQNTFTWLRGNDLVWNYVVSGWYMGKDPPPFDILAWNGDSTRMPATMHSQYLRACYMENALVRPGAFEIDGTPVDLAKVDKPSYVLTAQNDHIAPWRSAYLTTQAIRGDSRHVLSSGGHIAGIVNPPSPKASYRLNPETPPAADEWLSGATLVEGSWWDDWVAWASARSGERVPPPDLPPGDPAPGTYVHG